MPHSTILMPAPARALWLRRALAGAQVLKETLSAVVLVLPGLLARPWLAAAAAPGLVLYVLHGALALGRLPRRTAALIWGVTLVDEVGSWLFREIVADNAARQQLVRLSFFVGLLLSVLALTELAWHWRRRHTATQRQLAHHSWPTGRPRPKR